MKVRITSQQHEKQHYGHGKLLITGEYFVLDGAAALAVPVRFGQSLRTKELSSSDNALYWVALNSKKQVWLNLVFDCADFSCINSQQEEAQRLSGILSAVRKLNPDFLKHTNDIAVETHLEFPNEWGLGSSSTLIHCVAQWGGVDSYSLLKNTIGGSGYDVVAAAHHTPVVYQLLEDKPQSEAVHWKPPFAEHIWFAYTGKKQLSGEAITYYKEQVKAKANTADELTRITASVLECRSLDVFEQLLTAHENIISNSLKLTKVKDMLFPDYWGCVKSLGAWGGDFVMLTNTRSETELKQYLKEKGIDTVFSWNELIFAAN